MNFPRSLALKLLALAAVTLTAGCIHHEETNVRDVARVSVEFENEAAGRIFYEALSKSGQPRPTESKTDVSLPVIFAHKTRTVTGPNFAFNDAVNRCDTNHDGEITELEAKIFAENKPK